MSLSIGGGQAGQGYPAVFVYESHGQDCRYKPLKDVCSTVSQKYGTGGGNVPIVLQSNQNNAMCEDTETCYCLTASMGLGGGYVPMIVDRGGCWTLDEKMGQTYIHYDQANTLAARDYKQPQLVVTVMTEEPLIFRDDITIKVGGALPLPSTQCTGSKR